MSASLISGQPLYRLYSKFACVEVLSRLRASQVMGSVRLQVTGNPATASVRSRSRERKLLRIEVQSTLSHPWRQLIPATHADTPRKARRVVLIRISILGLLNHSCMHFDRRKSTICGACCLVANCLRVEKRM